MSDKEIVERVVQPSEIHDLLADVEDVVRDLDEPFARIEITGVTSEQRNANQRLVKAVEKTDSCLNCGEPIDDGGFCGYQCLVEAGRD